MNITDYNYPIGQPRGFFNGRVPLATPATFPSTYDIDYLRYLYFLCIKNAEGDYPIEINREEIDKAFQNEGSCKPRIKKILIGEAPPPTYLNYFYNPSPLRWNAGTGNPTVGQAWTSAIKNTLFPGIAFPDTISFLKACAQKGFLLLDLFPYNISYSGRRTTVRYRNACISAFGGTSPYPHNIINTLTSIKCCLHEEISISFAMKSFGEIILNDASCVANITLWLAANGIILYPAGPINSPRLIPVKDSSKYLRVCGRRYLLAPCSNLMGIAGI
jgi:hypothetical protein